MPSSPDLVGGTPGRTPVLGAFLEGWRRVLRAPMLSAGMLLASFLFALPMAMTVRDSIAGHLGSSLEADRAVSGWNAGWAAEFGSEAGGLGQTFTHEILGFGATLAAISGLLDNEPLTPAMTVAVALYIALWVFMWGGLIDRLARGRAVRTAAFFGACATYFLRFLRLGIVVGGIYWALFRWVHPWLFRTLYDSWTRDLTAETDAVLIRGGLYAVFLSLLAGVNLAADFAKVRAVVEDRRSMISALSASLRFIRRRFFRAIALYLVNVIAMLAILRLWMSAAPEATAPSWLALLTGMLYLLARIWARLAFVASETVFFQGELAHAGYSATPEIVWPDSPAVESIQNLRRRT